MKKEIIKTKNRLESILILHNIRSVVNVGAMFRTCDAVGVARIVLSGYTPTPIDRFGRVRNDFVKSSLGSEKSVSWSYVENIFEEIKNLKQEGFCILGIEQDKNSVDYKNEKLGKYKRIAFVVGTETTGMDSELLEICDVVCEIPMNGEKESLNVSVAMGIVLYRILDR